ncbi:hypothetical protein BGW38_007859 [Lunasporangiospora selenospora]|uniref:Uncharacterized protein n=1 Tax=Lunasporangiospora selenospora TaxID=979761 RepID=A0A9P6FKW1_9FUNG|nr:hypothetical protein BGW38_007859 [Lunasporangiospora selenospora]
MNGTQGLEMAPCHHRGLIFAIMVHRQRHSFFKEYTTIGTSQGQQFQQKHHFSHTDRVFSLPPGFFSFSEPSPARPASPIATKGVFNSVPSKPVVPSRLWDSPQPLQTFPHQRSLQIPQAPQSLPTQQQERSIDRLSNLSTGSPFWRSPGMKTFIELYTVHGNYQKLHSGHPTQNFKLDDMRKEVAAIVNRREDTSWNVGTVKAKIYSVRRRFTEAKRLKEERMSVGDNTAESRALERQIQETCPVYNRLATVIEPNLAADVGPLPIVKGYGHELDFDTGMNGMDANEKDMDEAFDRDMESVQRDKEGIRQDRENIQREWKEVQAKRDRLHEKEELLLEKRELSHEKQDRKPDPNALDTVQMQTDLAKLKVEVAILKAELYKPKPRKE